MSKLFRHYVLARAQFHKAGPDIEKALDPVLVFIRNLTGSQCNRFTIGTEQLKRGDLVTTLARQF